ncbi:MAG: class I SAM-dependent methyltransferase, partial [Cytophagales bacterium]|nr:class I SAM-dependent methyltransferase [Cytophagales bacterium]
MTDAWTQRWNERYENKEFAYGEEPNQYLREQLAKLSPGSILFPAEGEGRNAVHAAKMGWQATGFDISEAGKNKALQLAEKNRVSIRYLLGTLESLDLGTERFDAMGLIYAHFPASIKSQYHRRLNRFLRVHGIIIFEAFSKEHIHFVR